MRDRCIFLRRSPNRCIVFVFEIGQLRERQAALSSGYILPVGFDLVSHRDDLSLCSY